MTRASLSDTASEEDEPVSSVAHGLKSKKNGKDILDFSSEDDFVPLPLSEKPTANNRNPQKRKLKSVIGGRAQPKRVPRKETPTPPISPPQKLAKPTKTTTGAKPASLTVPVVNEHVFHHSGPTNYTLEDAPVALFPYENKRARGGFAVQVMQKGQFVGLISAGEEEACRKLLSEGWKGELRYLGGGKSEIVMRKN